MKHFGKTISLLGEVFTLSSFQMQMSLWTIAYHCKNDKTPKPLNNLFKLMNDTFHEDEVIEWVSLYTPFQFNKKKKKFVQGNRGKWDLASGFASTVFLDREQLRKIKDKYSINDISDFTRKSHIIQKDIDDLHEKINRYQFIDSNNLLSIPRKSSTNQESQLVKPDNFDLNRSKSNQESIDIIKKYLAKNPVPELTRKFGTPQSKYRYGTYGLGSMEYDNWSK